jgi:hypothetical protein
MWAITLAVILAISITNASNILTSNTKALHFLLLGDWGKGGNTGYIKSKISDNDEVDDDESNEKHQGDGQIISKIEGKIKILANDQPTNQAAIAKAMGSYSDSFMPSFVIALGDNFYANGVSSSTDSYWDYLWVNVYLDYYPSLCIPWYPVFGK